MHPVVCSVDPPTGRPRGQYFDNLDAKLGPGTLSKEEIEKCRSLGILADADDRGVLLQIFTKPVRQSRSESQRASLIRLVVVKVGDRATFFFEIIQRVGCMADEAGNKLAEQTPGRAVRDRSIATRVPAPDAGLVPARCGRRRVVRAGVAGSARGTSPSCSARSKSTRPNRASTRSEPRPPPI